MHGGPALSVVHGLDRLASADTVIVPGYGEPENPSDAVTAALARAAASDGPEATTHWHYAAEPAQRFPRASVRPDVLYVDEGRVLTSAGVAAGLELCLHLVRRDHGARVANQQARLLVAAPTARADRPSTSTCRCARSVPTGWRRCTSGRCAACISRSPSTSWPTGPARPAGP